jgi:tRNA 2-thiouridine synthesizing protein A
VSEPLRIDARGMRCPWPAIRLGRALRERQEGLVEVLADDPAAPRELEAVAQAHGVRLNRIAEHCFRVEIGGSLNTLFTDAG